MSKFSENEKKIKNLLKRLNDGNENGLIEMVHVTSTKNREREYLNAKLNVNNVRIEQ